ncbi:hypothetical protein DYB25_005577 [Aphanomyces astaci]|uniref:Uncharacterized protein n=1 Tax=Aphanomyces astaci TaxID=112090 RepID=A0A397DPS4_APHAT|nr:hypothetical protein DYB25_005577 [Aphanomyces astaci]RHY52688.1 hypothetical protein DYB34_001916 [Aphanomyces astaci]RHY66012.1 hypothetical protein DYB30_002505 [Aphanomyces astaci]RHZ20823.1 hypothetical protein DYB26_004696 [Aphanomyces astaci]
MSLLDLPVDVISMDDAEDHMNFDVDLCKMEIFAEGRGMQRGKAIEAAAAPTSAFVADAFCPSYNLVEDGFDDGVDDFGGLHLDNTGFDSMSFYEYGPFSPVASPKAADLVLEKVHASFTTTNHSELTASAVSVVATMAAKLPPKYFKTVQSSPQKRRVVSRSWNQVKSFSFASSTACAEKTVPSSETLATPTSIINMEPSREQEPMATLSKTPVRAGPTRRTATATPIQAKPVPVYCTPMLPLKKASTTNNLASHATMFVSPQVKTLSTRSSPSSSTAASQSGVGMNKWPLDKSNVALPPRYLQGPHASPEKKRVHSITFGKSASFSFSPSKSPRTALLHSSTTSISTGATDPPPSMRRAQSLQ